MRDYPCPSDSEREEHGTDHSESDGTWCQPDCSADFRKNSDSIVRRRRRESESRNGARLSSKRRNNADRTGCQRLIRQSSLKRFFSEFDRYEAPLIASLQGDARSFKQVLLDFREQHGRRPTSTLMLIGPEGDFTPAESALAKTAGCLPVSLGPIVLRTETAAIYSLSVLAYELQGSEN